MSSQLSSHWFILTSQPAQHKLPMVRARMLSACVLWCVRFCLCENIRFRWVVYLCRARVSACCRGLEIESPPKLHLNIANALFPFCIKCSSNISGGKLVKHITMFAACPMVVCIQTVCVSVSVSVCWNGPNIHIHESVPTYPLLEIACDCPYASVQSHTHSLSLTSHLRFCVQ